ncbi:hypothetical protein QCM80_42025 [Bradyrhizobium sp. SSUT112]|uniref:hypothetical protein n=1 Tax=Bradyrhizobium sp. SSUT112 TaxID=3040604 RepID=UPI00244B8000|nr:hypothetical protein [Bradyrhizobium sp. SSUT112]MDH2357116.1 hypothetical protein [Bradyrhizobium sp. SSUT112]
MAAATPTISNLSFGRDCAFVPTPDRRDITLDAWLEALSDKMRPGQMQFVCPLCTSFEQFAERHSIDRGKDDVE